MLRRVGIAASVAAAGAATLQRRAAESHAAAPAPESLAAQRPPSVVRVAPLDDPPDVTLEYFALRGLGELPRLILELTGIPYDSVYHFGTGVYKPYAPFGQLPVLRDGPLLICESGAIARHVRHQGAWYLTTVTTSLAAPASASVRLPGDVSDTKCFDGIGGGPFSPIAIAARCGKGCAGGCTATTARTATASFICT